MSGFVKDPVEDLDYAVDYSGVLAGDALQSSAWTVSPTGSLTLSRAVTIGPLATVWLTGGLVGVDYELSNVVTTVAGRTLRRVEPVTVAVGGTLYELVVDVAQLRNYMSGITLTEAQLNAAVDVLGGVQRELERYINRPLTRKSRTETIRPDGAGRLWPAATPVVSVSTVGFEAAGNEIVGGYGLAAGFTGPLAQTVTYVGGIDGAREPDVVLAIQRIAAREVTTRHDDTLSIKDLTSRNEGEPVQRVALGLTPDESVKLDRLRRRTVVS